MIAHNPRAGAGDRSQRIAALGEALRQRQLEVRTVTELADLTCSTHDLEEAGKLRAVVAAGGDGTFNEVLNRTPEAACLAPYPLGTENLVARYLRWPASPSRAAETIARGSVVRLDAARANGRLFALMIGVGFDAEVVRRVAVARRGHITRWTYVKPLLSAIRTYKYPQLRVYCGQADEASTAREVRWVFGVNLPRYALGLSFTPRAVGNDGLLDLCTFEHGSFLHGMRYLAFLAARRHAALRDVTLTRVQRFRVESADGRPVPYQLDGDDGGELPVDVETVPARLRLVVPGETARRLQLTIERTRPE